MTVEGQDWAGYQSSTPSTKGLGFVFVKATEGRSFVNDRHDVQVAHARADGLVVGHYHFQRPGSPTAQAAYFLAHAKPRAGDLLACDWEDAGVSCADKDAFIRAVQKAQPGLRVGLYANLAFWLHRDTTSFAGSFLWIADPSAPKGEPRVEHPWVFHQYSEAGGVDRNVGNFPDRAALQRWAAGGTTPDITEDTMTPHDMWKYANTAADAASVAAGHGHIPDAYGYLVQTHGAVRALTAQLAALTATVTALAKGGGLTAEQITAAAHTGAQAALAELGDVLTKEN